MDNYDDPRATIKEKLRSNFDGKIVRKDLTKKIKEGANVPTYVLEFLLGQYCSSDDDSIVSQGVENVKRILAENYVRPDESEKVLSKLRQRGSMTIIDQVTVNLNLKTDSYEAFFSNLGLGGIPISEEYPEQYDRLLCGGIWCIIQLEYGTEDYGFGDGIVSIEFMGEKLKPNKKKQPSNPIVIRKLTPIQMPHIDIEELKQGRKSFTKDEWIDVLLRSIGMEPDELTYREKWLLLLRMIPLVENNFNLCELGPRSTGKSHLYKEVSPNSILVSGGQTTVANLFYNMGRHTMGLVGLWDCVAFDEVAGIRFKDKDGVQIMKDYMASGSFARGKEEKAANASMVFVGNINQSVDVLLKTSSLFDPFPPEMGTDTAFLDRMHCYIPGWEIPKFRPEHFTDDYGFITDYLAEFLRELRKEQYGDALDRYYHLGKNLNQRDTMLMTRCGVYARDYYVPDDFRHLFDFNTPETISVLGAATSDVAEVILREIESTVKALRREEKNQNRTFANSGRSGDNDRRNHERSDKHGTDLSNGGRLSSAESRSAREPEDREIWDASARVPAETPQRDLHWDASAREPERAPGADRPAGRGDDGISYEPDGFAGRREREPESIGADALGVPDEQHPSESRGDRTERPDLRLNDEPKEETEGTALQPSGHDFDARSEIPYYHYSDEKQELLRISDALKNHRVTIAAYFADHEDSKERGSFIKGYFDSTFVEKILSNGQRAGYRAYDDVLTMWRGSYLSREMEVFMRWESVAASVHGMILMDRWLDPEERPLPTEAEQLSLIEEAQAEKETSFTLPQAAIDFVLAGGSGVSQGKFRIYEQFQKGESAEENVRFLKNEYGIGGHSDAIPGTGIWEDHDGKGITLKVGENSVTLKWPKVEKRIRELIAADRYLNRAEQEAFPNYLHGQEVRSERSRIAKEFEDITEGYSDYARDMGKADVLPARWYLVSCGTAFQIGEKRMYARTAEGDFILPMMREALQAIIDDGESPFTDRAKVVMAELSGPLAFGLEPTDAEMNPPPPPKKRSTDLRPAMPSGSVRENARLSFLATRGWSLPTCSSL